MHASLRAAFAAAAADGARLAISDGAPIESSACAGKRAVRIPFKPYAARPSPIPAIHIQKRTCGDTGKSFSK